MRRRIVSVILVVAGLFAGCLPAAASPDDWAPLRAQLQRIAAATTDQVGVSVENLAEHGGGQRIDIGSRTRMPSASLIKLPILVELLREAEQGKVSLTERVRVDRADVVGGTGQLRHERLPQNVSIHKLARYMIIYSDNTATNLLIDRIGFAKVNALIERMGLTETVLRRKMMDTVAQQQGKENYTSARDITELLTTIWNRRVLTDHSRAIMLGFLRDQRLNELIPAALPPGAPIAHKTGTLEDVVTHDVGYYLVPGSELVVSFTTKGKTASGTETIHRMARAVWDYTQCGSAA